MTMLLAKGGGERRAARFAASRFARTARAAILLALSAGTMAASGPRYVTGPPFFTGPAGVAIGWKQPNLLYYTDPGDLSSTMNHEQADALVAAAMGVWNVPVASVTMGQGGTLQEHVSGANVYLDSTGTIFPTDVSSASAAAVPIAVIYDTDGSVTDTLLGSGASDPSECRGSSVTESVDRFDAAGYITHALIVLNGRCTGNAPELQLQMRYDLMRAFGRVLGLAWSQTNDNVFTGTPTPTYGQAMHWPIMHPIDILCGPFSYQCLPNPFELRPDDVSSMVTVYPIGQNAALSKGKQPSLMYADAASGNVSFPTGQGMAGVNVVMRRRPPSSRTPDAWFEASAVTGTTFIRAAVAPFALAAPTSPESFGTPDQNVLGRYLIAYLPLIDPHSFQSLIASIEPVNPLYTGAYSLGPYALGVVTPAGSAPAALTALITGPFDNAPLDFSIADAPSSCGTGTDGTVASPAQAAASGWWNGLICGYGHASYAGVDVRPGRSFTVEVTALDEQGFATEAKAMPVIALFAPTDSAVTGPSLGSTPSAFQALGPGMTTLSGDTGQLSRIQIAIADERGDGRPDFAYQARVFYADTLAPALVGSSGGRVTISGMGFRQGNAVLVNGFEASVVSWTATTILLDVPVMIAAQAMDGTPVDVTVMDRGTGASSTMTGALTYAARPANTMRVLTAPSGTVSSGGATVPFSVQVTGADGLTPVIGEVIAFSSRGGSVEFAACGSATCNVQTDAQGVAASGVQVLAAGTIAIQAADGPVVQGANFIATAQASSMVVLNAPAGELKVGEVAQTRFVVRDFGPDGSSGLPGRLITFRVQAGSASYSGCFASICSVLTDANGIAAIALTPTGEGLVTLEAVDGSVRQTISFIAINDTDTMTALAVPSATGYVHESLGSFNIRLFHKDGISGDYYQYVTFTAPEGVKFGVCGSNVCQMLTNTEGVAGTSVSSDLVGTFSIQVAYGAVVQRSSFTVSERTIQLRVLSAPTGDVAVGSTASIPFSAEVIGLDQATPMAGIEITLAGPEDAVLLNACHLGTCLLVSDGNGIVTTTVTPLRPGPITLNAVYVPQTQTASFNATGGNVTLRVLAQPPATGAFVQDWETFTVQLVAADGITPLGGRRVDFSVTSGSLALLACSYGTCSIDTDVNGQATMVGIPEAGGVTTVQATNAQLSVTMSFAVSAKTYGMQLLSTPPSGIVPRGAAAGIFAVRVLGSDGVTPAPGRNVTFSVVSGGAQIDVCPEPACVVVTDNYGVASISVTPLNEGAVTLLAADNAVTQTGRFITLAASAQMRLISAPAGEVGVGATAPTAFAVMVVRGDGVTPLGGVPVVFSQGDGGGTGLALFEACGLPMCTVVTDVAGVASTTVAGVTPGAVTLMATIDASFGGGSVSDGLQIVGSRYSLIGGGTTTYLAESASLGMRLDAIASVSGSTAGLQPVQWSADVGSSLSADKTVTDGAGQTSNYVTLGPLSAGKQTMVRACAWTSVCTTFRGIGVSLEDLGLAVVSGGQQRVIGGVALVPVIAQVRDGLGHPVVMATVRIYQTAAAMTMDCPSRGRCPLAPVQVSRVTVTTSDANGLVVVQPLEVSGVGMQVQMVLSTGTHGFATVVLSSGP